MRKKIPVRPRIILLANDRVGLRIAKYLKQRKENIAGLVLHQRGAEKLAGDIKRIFPRVPVFYANRIRDTHYIEKIRTLKPDIAISAWFGYILKKDFIDLFPSGVINFHNSYLPVNRGKNANVWAVYDNSPYGVTLHYIDEGIDTGDIVVQKRMRVGVTDTAGTIYERSLDEIAELFMKEWPNIKKNKYHAKKQPSRGAVHHFAREVGRLDEIVLDKKYKAEELLRRLRARSYGNRSYAYFIHKGKKVYVKIVLSDDHHC